jgi:transcriptional regulator with XRE-family HTH domain
MMLAFKKQSSSPFSYREGMAKGTPELRKTVAANLRALMDRRQWSQMDLSGKSKVSQRHISNMLNSKTSASFETLNAVAAAFGVPGWLLMIEGLHTDLLDSQKIPLLVASYCAAGPDGQALVERLAEREAVHNRGATKVSPLKKHTTG